MDGGEDLTVCVDESYEGLNDEGRGERLFDSEGETTDYLTRIIEFLQDYERQFSVTKAFCAKLKELDLLMDGTAQIDLGGDAGKRTLGGLKVVNEASLGKLEDEQLLGLARSGELRAIHAHLSSLGNINQLADRAREKGVAGSDASVEQPEASVEA